MMSRQELTARSVRCKEVDPNSPMIGLNTPVGSVSQTLHLYNNQNDLVVEFHRFITPEGKIGASGLNDPKKIVINNMRFHQEKQGQPQRQLTGRQINQILNKRGLAAILTHIIGFYYRLNPPPS